jgi:hypothetical protein
MATSIEQADAFLESLRIPPYKTIYGLGCFANNVTFASQQSRAFNCVWALSKCSDALKPQSRVAVVGGGLGGLTTAAALRACEHRVDIYERNSQLCALQRGNDSRFVHPYILQWPDPVCEMRTTAFPYLNWTASTTRGVIDQVLAQWAALERESALTVKLGADVTAVGERDGVSWLSFVSGSSEGAGTEFYDTIVLAVGFGLEQSLHRVPFVSYWHNDALHQEMMSGTGRMRVLVTGTGDGGLIDALRLSLRNFDHERFVHRFLRVAQRGDIASALLDIEHQYSVRRGDADIGVLLHRAYDAIQIPPELRKYFVDERRPDTEVVLNSPVVSPLGMHASLLNRFATYLAMKYSGVRYLPGRTKAKPLSAGQYLVRFAQDKYDKYEATFDHIVVRHGPSPAIRRLIPAARAEELRLLWKGKNDRTMQPLWLGGDVFPPEAVPSGLRHEVVLKLAIENFGAAYEHLSVVNGFRSLSISRSANAVKYVVHADTNGDAGGMAEFGRIPVVFVQDDDSARSGAGGAEERRNRVLHEGMRIYNADAMTRSPIGGDVEGVPGVGTLGYFVRDQVGKPHLVCAAHVLSPGRRGVIGDRIYVNGESDANGDEPIGRLSLVRSAADDNVNTVDVAAAELLEGVLIEPSVGAARECEVGETVYLLVGVASRAAARVEATGIGSRVVIYGKGGTVLQPCIGIAGLRSGVSICGPGDGGCAVVDETGRAVGLLLAAAGTGKGQRALVTPITSMLDAIGMQLVSRE